MKAVAYRACLPVEQVDALIDVDLPDPSPGPRDLLVEVRAVSVNPVDTKIRRNVDPGGETKVLGYDAAGVVRAVGPDVTLFGPGDEVFYAGDLTRPGTNAELHMVDERIVGHKPTTRSFADAASLPLTAITAWELLFDRLGVQRAGGEGATLLVVGGAGGVGSILIQLAAQLTGLTVVATASRPETSEWVRGLGADHVIDHSVPLAEQYEQLGLDPPGFIAALTHTDQHFADLAVLIAPQGRLGIIDDPGMIDVSLLKRKSASLHWEFMFTRSMFGTADMIAQHALLDEVASLVDAGLLRPTTGENYGPITATALRRAHQQVESHNTMGKIVLEGF